MRTQVAKWGNSLAVRIPLAYAKEAGLREGSAIEIVSQGDSLVLKKRHYSLEALLAEVKPENLHGETGTGSPRGQEAW